MLKRLWKYLKSERGEVGAEDNQALLEKIAILENENDTIKGERDAASDELKTIRADGKSDDELNVQKISDLERENEALKTKEKDSRSAIDKLKIQGEFPGIDADLIGSGSYEEMKAKAEKLRDFKTEIMAKERGVEVVDLKEEWKNVPGAQGEYSERAEAEKKGDADKKLQEQMEKGTSKGVFQAILNKALGGSK